MDPGSPLRHDAFVYETDDDYVERSVAFLRQGLEAGDGCMVANRRPGIAMLREALGSDAERVRFVDNSSTYTRPARAVAAYYEAFVEELQRAPVVRAVADMNVGPTAEDWEEWTGYEAITNLAYAHLPVWVVCTYGADLPDPVLDSVLRTHAEVDGDDRHSGHEYEDPRALVREVTPTPEELPDLRSISAPDDLELFRERLARELAAERVPEASALDMLIAASEVAANAARHGDGLEEVRVGRAKGRFVCEIVDRGSGFDDPVAGYLVPREGVGAGLWVARQLARRVESFQSSRGFTVRLWL